MEKLYDRATVEKYLEKKRLREHFETENLNFFVIEYQPGEFLSRPEQPITYFQFMVKGSASLYYLDEGGARRNVTVMENDGILGDMEFVLSNIPIFYIEALSPIITLALPMEKNRPRLEKDCKFLMYLLEQASRIKVFTARNAVVMPRLEERLVYYLKNDCPRGTMIGMEAAAAKLQCSRRQLQRVVKKLEAQGRLAKQGRGCYRLISTDEF
ncbi:MAG: Crp/Fnr family transcriptional regulator [Clostridium sp.]|nr:Crp/Fnr family transcriptional regulator [Clostridium sp.]